MDLKGVKITWLGHGTFLFEHGGKKTLVDPWIEGNPSCPGTFNNLSPDVILITHGHGDHIGDLFAVADRSGGPIVGIFDLTTWAATKGIEEERLVGMNKGGTVKLDGYGIEVTMVQAIHSSSFVDEDGVNVYLGEPAGYVIKFDEGLTVYVAGDTSLFGDMEWIGRLYQPELAILPIGDRFTMDPKAAAWACQLTGVTAVIPAHFGTFPLLTGTVGDLKRELKQMELNVEVIALEPGQHT